MSKRNNNTRVRGNYVSCKDNVQHEKAIDKVIKINSSKIKEIKYIKHRCQEYKEIIDIYTRNVFKCTSRSSLKCMTKLNSCRSRIEEINNNSTLNFYLYCYVQESWSHIIQ